jgi:tellurium resistance protein TerD
MSGINLSKGDRINLTKSAPSLKRVRIGLGWEPNPYDTGSAFDLDASVFICNSDSGAPKLINNQYFVFYGNPLSPDGAVKHSGDNRTGNAPGDDETITVDLTTLGAAVDELSIIVTIHEADTRKQNFGQVPKSHVTLYDDETGAVVASYDLEDSFSSETAVQFGSLYKKNGEWSFKAIGGGFKRGLADFVVAYGGTLA